MLRWCNLLLCCYYLILVQFLSISCCVVAVFPSLVNICHQLKTCLAVWLEKHKSEKHKISTKQKKTRLAQDIFTSIYDGTLLLGSYADLHTPSTPADVSAKQHCNLCTLCFFLMSLIEVQYRTPFFHQYDSDISNYQSSLSLM